MQDIYYPSNDGKTTIHATVWRPESAPRGVVQIIHGMCEYGARYAPFAERLASLGFLVVADDHLGHGKSVQSPDRLGYFDDKRDYMTVIKDIRHLHLLTLKETGGLPYFVLGHSMGSFFCRKYISLYGRELAGAVIMGTGFKSKLTLNTAIAMTRLNALFKGWNNRSRIIKKLAFGAYNKKFKPARTGEDWLSKDEKNVDDYIADELCGFDFTDNGYYVLFSVIKQACAKKTIKAVPENLPVYFVAGDKDPVGDYGKGVIMAAEKFREAGVKSVQLTLYEDARHEILNDFCKERVTQDIIDFIQSNMV